MKHPVTPVTSRKRNEFAEKENAQAVKMSVRPQEPSRKQEGIKIPEKVLYSPGNSPRSKRTPKPQERLCLNIDRLSGEPKVVVAANQLKDRF